MDDYIPISALNDFLFCPHSLYYHALYASFDESVYHQKPQVEGRLRHSIIDTQTYSTRKDCLQGLSVCSQRYRLVGKIDTFFADTGVLVERKTRVKRIYDGYRFQLFGQLFALREMGYMVNSLALHSLLDNKRYAIDMPRVTDIEAFESLLDQIRSFDPSASQCACSDAKRHQNIYQELY